MLNSAKNRALKPFDVVSLRSSSLVRNISKVYGGDVLSKVLGTGTLLLLIRGLSVDDYAAYTAFWAILSLLPGLVGGGVNKALVRFSGEYLSRNVRRPCELYLMGFLFQVVLYVVTCGFLFSVSDKVSSLLFGNEAFSLVFQYGLIAGLGVLLIEGGRSIYQAEERFGNYIRTLWVRQILSFIVILTLFLVRRLDIGGAVFSVTAVNLVVGTAIGIHIFENSSFKKLRVFLTKEIDIVKDFVRSTGWLSAYFFTLATFQRLDIFMLSHFSTELELANYGVAFRYYSMALLLLGSIHAVLLPRFAKVDMQEPGKQRSFAFGWFMVFRWLIIPIAMVDLFGKSIFVWINGTQYEKAFYIFVVFSVGIWLSLMFSPLVNVLISRKAFKFLFVLAVGALIMNFAGNYLLIPIWGGIGAAVATIVSHGLINIASGARISLSDK